MAVDNKNLLACPMCDKVDALEVIHCGSYLYVGCCRCGVMAKKGKSSGEAIEAWNNKCEKIALMSI